MKKLYLGFLSVALGASILAACSTDSTTTEEESAVDSQEEATTSEPAVTEDVANAEKLLVYGDVVESGGCTLQSRFTVGERIVFRVNVEDALTGEQPKDAKVIVHLSTGDKVELHHAPHPPEVEGAQEFWAGGFNVTEDIPTGTLEYYVTAETEDKSGEFRPFQVQPSLLTIVPADQAVGGEEPSEQPES